MISTDRPMNQILTRLDDIVETMGPPPWRVLVIDDGRNNVPLSAGNHGEGNKEPHIHPDFNETWIIGKGEYDFGIGHYPKVRATFGDVIISHLNTVHIISAIGAQTSIRIPISKIGSDHSILGTREEGTKPFPPGPPNLVHTNPFELAAARGPAPWSQDVQLDMHLRINLTCSAPGEKTDQRAHPDWHVWWMVLRGELEWEVEGHGKTLAKSGDLVFVPSGSMYQITTVGDQDALRYWITPGNELRSVFPDGSGEVYRPDFTGVSFSLA